MDRLLLRRLIYASSFFCLTSVHPVMAECISPMLTPTECDFKDEDTQVLAIIEGFMQRQDTQTYEFSRDLQVWEKQWRNALKLSGPRDQLATVNAAIAAGFTAIQSTIDAAAAYQAADPLELRTLLLPQRELICATLYMDPGCQETVDPEVVTAIMQAISDWQKLLNYDHLTLGYTPGDIEQDLMEVRGSYNELDYLSHTRTQQAREQIYEKAFPIYEDLMFVTDDFVAAASFTREEGEGYTKARSAVVQDTIRDSQSAMRRMLERMTEPGENGALSDLDQSRHYKDLVDYQLGLQQTLENKSQQEAQLVEGWMGVNELYLEQGSIFGSVYLAEEAEEEYRNAATIRHIEPTPFSNANVDGSNDPDIVFTLQ
ncbi:MAG: hypothetical protein KDJ38_00145 [Gammaproteobacteria bacterium]|nr:hypothetical protein [Gammaproteobacteria bacterium]